METPMVEKMFACSYGKNNKSLSFVWTLEEGARWVVVGKKQQVAQFKEGEFRQALKLYNNI